MRTNGKLQFSTFVEGGFNGDGEPIKGVDGWSEDIPCSIKTVTNNSKGRYEDGKFNQASYEVLTESDNRLLTVKRIRLFRGETELGEFVVQGLPTPTIMDRIKIIV